MYNLMIFSKFIELCNYHHNSVLEHFHHSCKIPHGYLHLIPVSTLTPGQISTNLHFLDKFHINRIIEYMVFYVGVFFLVWF